MADGFFPTDVRVRVEGDHATARGLLGATRRVLFAALQIQKQQVGEGPVILTRKLTDEASVRVVLMGAIKVVTIFAGVPPPEEVLPELERALPEFPPRVLLTLLNGWIRGGSVVDGAMQDFRPTESTAQALKIPRGFNPNRRLAVNSTQHPATEKPSSMWSGTMKRVVQAVRGLGIITDRTRSYITNEIPDPARRAIGVQFDSDWDSTHGIYRADTRNHWVVEISGRGVLAMPLITFPSTRSRSYRSYLAATGQTDTLRVWDEFGGLPTGESIPSLGLEEAIEAGKVLRLVEAADMEEFYAGQPYSSVMGWAFSPTGHEAHNTCWRIMDPFGGHHFVPQLAANGNFNRLWGDHWKVSISLSPHDLGNLNDDQPVGTGSATIERVHRGMMFTSSMERLYVPQSQTGPMRRHEMVDSIFPLGAFQFGFGSINRQEFFYGPQDGPFGATIHVYFTESGRLIRVKWVRLFGGDPPLIAISLLFPVNVLDPDTMEPTGQTAIVPVWNQGRNVGEYSPMLDAIICEGYDPRGMMLSQDPDTGSGGQYVVFPLGVREGWISLVWVETTPHMWGMFGAIDNNKPLHFTAHALTLGPLLDAQSDWSLGYPPEWLDEAYFDAAINAGPSRQFAINIDSYFAGQAEVRTMRVALPEGLDNVKPLDMAWIGSV